jgi:hypothetical protein
MPVNVIYGCLPVAPDAAGALYGMKTAGKPYLSSY